MVNVITLIKRQTRNMYAKNLILSVVFTSGIIFSDDGFANISKEIQCMANNIYHEARGESMLGKRAVASVTMNRVKSSGYPKSVCGVVKQRGQFSWFGRKRYRTDIPQDILRISRQYVLNYGSHLDVTNGSMYYHASHVSPGWRGLRRTKRIGNHVFYR